MKKLVMISLASVMFFGACNERGESFEISGEIAGADGKTLYFEALTLEGVNPLDSVRLDDKGTFRFTGPRPANPEFYRLRVEGQIINVAIDSTEHIGVEADFPTMSADYKIDGSQENIIIREISRKQLAMQAEITQIAENPKLTTGERGRLVNQIVERYKADLKANYVLNEPWSAHAYFAIFQTAGRVLVFDPVDNAEDVKYLAAVATAWNERYPGSVRAKNLENIALRGLRNTKAPQEKVFDPSEWANVNIKETGLIEVALPDINGRQRTLSELEGKVVMLDFNAYSISGAQERTMQLRALYDELAPKGFEIYQISFDPDEHYWKTVTEPLPWICVYEEDGLASDYLRLYMVQNIPTYFLIDRGGNVVVRSDNVSDTKKAIEDLL